MLEFALRHPSARPRRDPAHRLRPPELPRPAGGCRPPRHRGGDAVVLFPTGAGKSMCYQVPALAREGVGIVVSPLIALMRDQVEALRQAGVNAATLNSSISAEEVRPHLPRPEGRPARPALRRARAPRAARLQVDDAGRADLAHRHRRGALRQPVGARFPPRISRARLHRHRLSRRAAPGADRHRRPHHPRRHRRSPRADRCPGLHHQLRSPQHQLLDRRARQRPPAAEELPRPPHRQFRHRLLPVAQEGRRHRRVAEPARASAPCRTMPA